MNDPLSKYETTIVIKADGTYTQKNTITIAGVTEKYSGTYKVIDRQNVGSFIQFSANDAIYQITANNELKPIYEPDSTISFAY